MLQVLSISAFPPPSVENGMSNIPEITDNKTSPNRNIPAQKPQIRERTVSPKNLRNCLIGDSMIKDVDSYL